jgi:hypothetical protein
MARKTFAMLKKEERDIRRELEKGYTRNMVRLAAAHQKVLAAVKADTGLRIASQVAYIDDKHREIAELVKSQKCLTEKVKALEVRHEERDEVVTEVKALLEVGCQVNAIGALKALIDAVLCRVEGD